MRRTITAILAIGLVAGAFSAPMAEAKKKKPKKYSRTAEASYTTPPVGVSASVAGTSAGGGYCAGFPGDCVSFPTTAKDKYVKIKVDDSSGTNVVGYIDQGDTTGDGVGDLVHRFCGEHAVSVPITAGVPVGVNIYSGTCDESNPSAATTGTVTATFSNKPF